MHDSRPRVVVVGAGFGGLEATRNLAKLPLRITLVDRKNHHTFQPLLYQVATAGISPGEIAAPIRWILRSDRNVEVLMGEVVGFDLTRKMVQLPISKFHMTIWLWRQGHSIHISDTMSGNHLPQD